MAIYRIGAEMYVEAEDAEEALKGAGDKLRGRRPIRPRSWRLLRHKIVGVATLPGVLYWAPETRPS